MTEDKDRQKPLSTCLEGSPCAEMMQKIMSEQGLGSGCEEMMRACLKKFQENPAKPEEAGKDENQVNGGVK